MFPAAPAAPFARNVACRGVLVIYFLIFKIYYVLLRFLTLYYDIVISRCVMEALRYVTVIHDLSRLLARSSTVCYVLLRSVAF